MTLSRTKLSKIQSDLLRSLQETVDNFKVPPGILEKVAIDLYERLNTPVALSCAILLRSGDLAQLLSKVVDPLDYLDPLEYRDSAQAVAFLKKVPYVAEGIDPEKTALETFRTYEKQCADTNNRFRHLASCSSQSATRVKAIISMAAQEVQNVLSPSVPYREWFYACRFGPGVFTHSQARGLTSLYDKLQVRPSATAEWASHGALLVTSAPPWARSVTDCEIEAFWPIVSSSEIDFVPGNRITFVPKTAITKRTIAIEPLLNIYAQLGLGAVIRRRIRRSCGIDLDDQTPNQEGARLGSIDGSLATIDLSSASDSVAREFVRFMLPDSWYHVLDIVRSKVGLLDKEYIRYEKFSSMGNGYTFELETLLFWALSKSVCRHLNLESSQIRVYGDDIIVPTPAFQLLSEVLEFCGFTVNRRKSFSSGYFRESCGKDWFNGVEVRPFYQKESLHEIQHLIRLANGLRMLAHRRNRSFSCDLRLFKPWASVLRAIPRSVRLHLRVPRHAGDSDGIKMNLDEASASAFTQLSRVGWEGWHGLRLQATPVRELTPSNMLGVIAEMLYRSRDGGGRNAEPSPPRLGRKFVHRLQPRAFYGPWTDFGDWSV